MKTSLFFCLTFFWVALNVQAIDPKTLEIGTKAPDFKLPGTDGKTYSLASFSKAKVLVVVFTCNHCPTAQAYEDRIIRLTNDYKAKGVQVVAISTNDPSAVRLDELGYTDLSDTFEEMKIRYKDKKYNFPYLYDGATQVTSLAYGAVATPHVFIFDQERKLQYVGRFDDVEKPTETPKINNARDAVEALLTGKPIAVQKTKSFGCSVKWKEKSDWIEKGKAEWAKEEVKLQSLNPDGLRKLLKNDSEKLRVINVWATWCGPCVVEFPEFVTMNRMYRGRDFEFVSITTDKPAQREKALKFLKGKQASNTNYILDGMDVYQFIEIIDPKWQGALPYTLIIEPGGKVVYTKQGAINALEIRKKIVESPTVGRYY
ncbi:MAG: redoxin domain-containing protein [Spirosomataceae bacterium]